MPPSRGLWLIDGMPVVNVPVISVEAFTPGASWTWDYTAADGSPWSTERYTVISRNGSRVVLEISSDYGGSQNLKPNTRLAVDVDRCLKAYSNPIQKKGWSYSMFSLSNGKWTEFDAPNTLAFEEKFNCNPWTNSPQYLTVFDVRGSVQVFQQKLWKKLTGSWFGLAKPFDAVQIEKDFETSYTSRLRR